MEKIRQGKEKQENVLDKAKKFLTKLLGDFKKKEKDIGTEILKSVRETQDIANYMGQCPKCKEGRLMVRRGRFGRFVGCDKYPDCKTIINIPKTGKIKFTGELDENGLPIVEAGTGRAKRKVALQVHKKEENTEKKYSEEGMSCPTCKEGQMKLRKSFYGEFLGCNNYPKCQTLMNIKEGKVDTTNPVVKKPGEKKAKKKKNVKKKVNKK